MWISYQENNNNDKICIIGSDFPPRAILFGIPRGFYHIFFLFVIGTIMFDILSVSPALPLSEWLSECHRVMKWWYLKVTGPYYITITPFCPLGTPESTPKLIPDHEPKKRTAAVYLGNSKLFFFFFFLAPGSQNRPLSIRLQSMFTSPNPNFFFFPEVLAVLLA